MPQPAPVFEQLLSIPQARSLEALASDAWDGLSRMLGAILGAEPALVDPGARLVMPDEIAGEFGDPHLAVPVTLGAGATRSVPAVLVIGTSTAARFVDAPPQEPGSDDSQTIVIVSTIAGQLVQAVNATTLAGAPGGLALVLGEVVANGMPAALDALDEPCALFEGLLNAGRALPFHFVLPASFLETFATATPAAAVPLGAAPAASAAPGPIESPLEPSPEPWREPTPIMAAPTAQRAHFSPLPDQTTTNAPANIDLLSDLQMSISVELGRTELSVADVLALGSGSVIELDRLAGEPVDILVNDRLIARGEVVVVDENFGVRIVEVLPRSREVGKAS